MNRDIALEINDIEGINLSLDVAVKQLEPPLENVDIVPSETKQVFKSQNAYGYDTVTVDPIPGGYAKPEGTLSITENGTYDVKNYESVETNIRYAPRAITFYDSFLDDYTYELSNIDWSNITDLSYMFGRCSGIVNLDLTMIPVGPNITDLGYMCTGCSRLENFSALNWNTVNVTRFVGIFYNCSSLTSLDLSTWVTPNVSSFAQMFYGCSKLKHLDVRNFTFSAANYHTDMLYGVPKNCEIIVKNTTEKNWFKSKFSAWTNVKTVAEYTAQ